MIVYGKGETALANLAYLLMILEQGKQIFINDVFAKKQDIERLIKDVQLCKEITVKETRTYYNIFI